MNAIQAVVVFCKTTGMIKSTGTTCAAELLETAENGVLIDAYADITTDFVLEGTVQSKGERPSINHTFNYATKQWEIDLPATWYEVRRQRNQLLAASDWTQLPDVPIATKEVWVTYRQALRDVGQQPDPLAIVWPVAP